MADRPARLVLADGTVFRGRSVGAIGTAIGEAVFNTGMTGYQEVLTDPSYRGQIVAMTYPHVGNYGINPADMESERVQVSGFVMRSCCAEPSNARATESLPAFLQRHGVVAMDGIDTRMLTRRLRVSGVINAVISSEDRSDEELLAMARAAPSMAGLDLASVVSTREPYDWDEPSDPRAFGTPIDWPPLPGRPLCVAIDCGIKRNILRLLVSCGLRVRVVPCTTPAEEILALRPAGIFLSNGPGDPAAATGVIATVRRLIATDLPIFGICLGHQILALAYGARTFKLKFGHRGINHPIKRLSDGKVEIASHNHGFAVDPHSLPPGVRMSHVNLNDGTCAGLEHERKPQFSVQYHPEAAPGPADPLYLFRRFSEAIRARL
ncbi:MAG: glutamine-hydrolyzing carbamoyl-phosphate synthase small subunit [Planctomycetota bacterium]|nr:glutamine-hydrolyzing carbamoyl-phosphate synthase small subunit [Planctomycetota bacterium]